MSRGLGGVSGAGGRGKMGRGGLGNRGPVTKFEKFSQTEAPAQAREEAGKHRPGKAEAPRKRTKIYGFVWFSKRVLEYQKEQIYII